MALDEAIAQLDALIAQMRTQDGASPSTHHGTNGRASSGMQTADKSQPAKPSASGPASSEPKLAAKKDNKQKMQATAPAVPAADRGEGLFARAHLRVAKVLTVEEINSAKLFKTTLDVGGGEVRQVVAGLKGHITREALLGSLVVAILNLKPAKLAGEASEAMLLAADAPGGDGGKELVRTLVPPEGSTVGDAVYLEGGTAGTEFPKTLKSDPWKKIVAGLSVQGGKATFEGRVLRTDRGVVAVDMADGAGIH